MHIIAWYQRFTTLNEKYLLLMFSVSESDKYIVKQKLCGVYRGLTKGETGEIITLTNINDTAHVR